MVTILIVEDNPLNLELMTDLLEMEGYTVLQAINAEEGIGLAQTQTPDLVLMDVAMPGLDGLTATRQLKTDPRTMEIPIIATTAHNRQADRERILSAGCIDCVTKPIDVGELLSLVSQTVGR